MMKLIVFLRSAHFSIIYPTYLLHISNLKVIRGRGGGGLGRTVSGWGVFKEAPPPFPKSSFFLSDLSVGGKVIVMFYKVHRKKHVVKMIMIKLNQTDAAYIDFVLASIFVYLP